MPALIEVLDGRDSEMRVCAAEALGRIGPGAREAVPSLIRTVAQREVIAESEVLVRHAIVALGRIGPDANAALPILNHLFEKRLGDEGELVIAMAENRCAAGEKPGRSACTTMATITLPKRCSPGWARRPVTRYPC